MTFKSVGQGCVELIMFYLSFVKLHYLILNLSVCGFILKPSSTILLFWQQTTRLSGALH
jgi:hypothetical protein